MPDLAVPHHVHDAERVGVLDEERREPVTVDLVRPGGGPVLEAVRIGGPVAGAALRVLELVSRTPTGDIMIESEPPGLVVHVQRARGETPAGGRIVLVARLRREGAV